ncbi:hypothetical protein Tco_1303719 [Tanacetum coccineum]
MISVMSMEDGELELVSDHSVNDDHIPIPSIEQTELESTNGKGIRETALKSQRVVHADVQQATPAWTNTNSVNKANQFTPRPVQLNNIRPNLSTASKTIKPGRVNVNTGHGNVSTVSSAGTQIKSGSSRFNTGKQNIDLSSLFEEKYTLSQYHSGPTPDSNVNDHPLKHMEHRVKVEISEKVQLEGNLVFDDVAFVKELGHFNLFSISQICDKKLNVLFTEKECFVVSSDFKMPDENQLSPAEIKRVIKIDVPTRRLAYQMVVSSTSLTGATRKAAVSEKIAKKKTHSPKQPSSTPISKSADDIMTFRKELDALALKHLGPSTFTPGNIEAISPSADHEERVFSNADDDEMHEIRIYDKSSEGIFEKASYDDDGLSTDQQSPD